MSLNGEIHNQLAGNFTYKDFVKLRILKTQNAMTESLNKVGFSFYKSEKKTDEDDKENGEGEGRKADE